MNVTTTSKSEEKLSDSPGIITVITKDELSRFGGITLSEILERSTGLSVTGSMDQPIRVSARGDQIGATSNHILVLVDGRPIRESLQSGNDADLYGSFPVNIIESIEIVRGPGSVLYGTNAFSSVINIKTKSADKTSSSVSVGAGPNGEHIANGYIGINNKDLKINTGFQYYQNPEWNVLFQKANRDTFNVDAAASGLGTFLSAEYKGFSLTTSYNRWEGHHFYVIPNPKHPDKMTTTRLFTNLGYNTDVSDSWKMSVNLTNTHYQMDAQSWMERVSNDFVGEFTNFIKPGEKLDLIVGGLVQNAMGKEDGKPEVVSGDLTQVPQSSKTHYAFYSQLNYALLSNLNLIGGIQLNKSPNVDLDINPRLGLVYYPTKRLNLKVLYAQAYRAASIHESYLNIPGRFIGNPELNAEKVDAFDASLSYFGEKMQVSATYFYAVQTDLITRMVTDTATNEQTFINIGEFTTQGIELETHFYLSKELMVIASYMHQENEDGEGNKNISSLASDLVKVGISYKNDGLTLSVFNNYVGDFGYDYYKNDINPLPEAYNLLSAHVEFNLNELLNMGMDEYLVFGIHGYNLLNSENWTPDITTTAVRSFPNLSSRSIFATIKLGF